MKLALPADCNTVDNTQQLTPSPDKNTPKKEDWLTVAVDSVRPQQTLLSQCRSQPFLSKQKEALEIENQGENTENGF
jgi:hypothetical protein